MPLGWASLPLHNRLGGALTENADNAFGAGDAEFIVVPHDVSIKSLSANGGAHTVVGAGRPTASGALTVASSAALTLSGNKGLEAASANVAANGTLILNGSTQSFRHVRLAPTRRRYPTNTTNGVLNGNGLAISEFRLTLGGEPVAWDGATLNAPLAGSLYPGNQPQCAPSMIMDGTVATSSKWFWATDDATNLDCFITFDFDAGEGKAFTFDGYQLAMADVRYRHPTAWSVYGSDDGVTWTALDTRTYTDAEVQTFATNTWLDTYTFSGSTDCSARFVRWVITAINEDKNPDSVALAEFQLLRDGEPVSWGRSDIANLVTSSHTQAYGQGYNHADENVVDGVIGTLSKWYHEWVSDNPGQEFADAGEMSFLFDAGIDRTFPFNGYRLAMADVAKRNPRGWRLEISNSAAGPWTVVDSQTYTSDEAISWPTNSWMPYAYAVSVKALTLTDGGTATIGGTLAGNGKVEGTVAFQDGSTLEASTVLSGGIIVADAVTAAGTVMVKVPASYVGDAVKLMGWNTPLSGSGTFAFASPETAPANSSLETRTGGLYLVKTVEESGQSFYYPDKPEAQQGRLFYNEKNKTYPDATLGAGTTVLTCENLAFPGVTMVDGTALDSSGTAITLTDAKKLAGTVTVSSGDLTLGLASDGTAALTGATIASGATLKIEGDWAGVSLPATGAGTLDLTPIKDGNRPTLTGKPLPTTILVSTSPAERESGLVSLPVASGATLPEGFTVVVDGVTYTPTAANLVNGQLVIQTAAPSQATGRSISLNVANGTNTYAANLSGDTAYGLVPVPGKNWVNLFDANASAANAVRAVKGAATVTRAYDALLGADTALGTPVSVTFSANNAWTAGTSAAMSPLFQTYLDDCMPAADGSPAAQVATIAVKDVPFARYDVIVYFSTGSQWKINATGGLREDESLGRMGFSPVTVNGVTYSWRNGALVSGEAAKGLAFGESLQHAPELGVNALRIPNLSGDLLVQGGPRNREVLADGRVIHSGRGTIAAIQIVDVSPSISVNMVGGVNNAPEKAGPIQGIVGNSGQLSVQNARWNDFSTVSLSGLVDSTGTATDAKVETDITSGAYGSYQNSTQNGYPNAITDRGAKYGVMAQGYREACASTATANTELRLRDIPYPRYDLILYLGTDKGDKQWNPVKVTTAAGGVTYYSYPAGSTDQAATASKTDPGLWGDTKNGLAAAAMGLGKDAMLIRNLSGDVDIDTGTWDSAGPGRGGICGFQIVYAGELRKAGALNLNFVGSMDETGVVQADETPHGLYPAPGTSWVNLEGASDTDVAIDNAYETDLSGQPTVSYASAKAIEQNITKVTILRGCILEGNVTVENVPYEMYDVIVYMTTASYGMAPVMVNGAYYTWDTQTKPVATTVLSHAYGPKWGPGAGIGNINTASAPEYGSSALRITAQTAKTLTVRPQLKQGHWASTQCALAAIQIVERIKVPVDEAMSWADATAGIDPSAPLYVDFGPNGQIIGDASLSDDDIVDIEEHGPVPCFSGALTTALGTEFRLPWVQNATLKLAGSLPNVSAQLDPVAFANIAGVYTETGLCYLGSDGNVFWSSSIHDRPVVWTGAAGDGDWDNPDNWYGGRMPNATYPSTVLVSVKDGEETLINIPDGVTIEGLTVVGRGDSGKVTINGNPTINSGKVTVEGKVTVDGSAFAEEAIAIDGDVTLGADVRPLPVITKGDAADPYGTVTIQPTLEEALKGGPVTLPAGSGLAAGDIFVEGIDKGAVTVTDKGDGSYEVTWKGLPATLSVNFGSNVKEIPDEATEYGVFPVAGSEWVDLAGASGETAVSDFGSAVKPVVTYTSRGVGVRPTNIDPILSGSLDTADITVKNVPYEKYDLIVYYATSYKNGIFPPVKVNGTYYTWDEALQTGYPTTVDGPSFGQGGTSYVGLGVNAQRIYGLTADTLNVVSHKSFNKDGKYHRGCIAGIQIVRRVVLTVDGEANWGDLTAGLDPNTPIEVSVLPGGSITGDVDLSQREDVIIDLTGFDFSQGDRPFAGNLTVKDTTTILLPTDQAQYQPSGDTVKGQIAGAITGNPILGLGDDRFQSNDDVTLSGGAVVIQNPAATLPTVWTGAGDGTNWNDPANWSTGKVPTADTAVVIPVKDGADLAITIPEGAAAGSVSIVGQGDSGNLTLNGGTLAVTGGLAVEGAVDVSQTGVVNAGSVTVDSGTLTVEQGASLGVTGETTLVNGGQLIIKGQATTGTLTLPEGVQGGDLAVEGTLTVTEGATLPGSLRPIPALTGDGDATLTITPTEDELASGAITLPKPDGFKDTNIAVEGVGEVQVSDAGDGNVTLTWVELPASLNLNFGSNVKEIPDDETQYGVFPVAGAEWVDLPNASGNQALDLGLTANPTVTYTSRGVGVRPTNIDPILSGSIDTATITVSNLPYGSYDVIVYFATSYKNGTFLPIQANGTYYTWDGAKAVATTAGGPSFGQGGTATAELGVNAIRIDGLSGDTLTLVSQKSFNAGGKYHRGCIAGVQIIRRAVVTVDTPISADDLAAKLPADGSPVKVEVLPGGSVSGDLDLSGKDVVVDLTDFDFSMGDKPFDGTLTVDGDTTLLLPTNPDQYQPNEDGTVSAPVADDIAGTPAIDAPGETAVSGGTVTVGTPDAPATFPNEWTGAAGDNDWANPDNWSQGVVPGAGSDVVIEVGAGETVTIPEGTQLGDLTVSGEGSVTIGGGTTVTGDLVIDNATVDVPIGTVTVAGDTTIQNGGALNVGDGQGDNDAAFNTGTLTKPAEESGAEATGSVTVKPDGALNVGTVDQEGTVTGGTVDLPETGHDVTVDGGSITVNGGTTDDTVINAGEGSTVTGPTGEGSVNVSGEGNVTVGGNVDLGETRPTVTFPEGGDAAITVTPTGDEAIKGEITLPGGLTEGNKPTVNVPGVSGDITTSVDGNGDLVITWTPDYPTLDETAGWADGDKWSTGSVPESGIVVVDGETNGPITVTLPEGGIAEGIDQVIVKGDVTFVGDALPPEVTPAPGATVTIGGTTLPEGWELPEGSTLVVTEPNGSLADATLEGEVILDFEQGTEADLTGADFPGGLEIKGEDVTVTVDDLTDTAVTVTGDVTLAGTDGFAPGFGDNGALTVAPDATLTLDPETDWADATVPVTGGGTLDVGAGRPTLDGAGEGNALPPTIVVTATEEELKNGAVTLPVVPGTTLPDGAQIVIEDAEGNHVATVGGALAEDTLTAGFAVMNPLPGGGDVSDAVKDAIVEDAMGNGVTGPFDVALTPNGKPAGNLDGATLEEALDIFEDLTPTVTEDAEGNKTLTYAFWFGIARFTLENGTWKVTAQAMDANAENKPAVLAAGCAYTLRTNLPGASTPKVTAVDEANRAQGSVVLTVADAPALSSAEGLACEIDLFIEAPQAMPAE